jgi:hypothetical protein
MNSEYCNWRGNFNCVAITIVVVMFNNLILGAIATFFAMFNNLSVSAIATVVAMFNNLTVKYARNEVLSPL